jgi:2-polyprenyl-3-methyl-5-hydroxy-6-metoxy-1,4-benzoquinol methylase
LITKFYKRAKNFYRTILRDHHQPVAIKTIDDFKKTDISYEQRVINENWTFDNKPRDENTGNEVAIDNLFVYKYLILERRLSAYKGLDYWDFIRHVVNSREYTRILSVGSGPCAVEMEIAEKFTKPYVIDCLDLNENLIKTATQRARDRGMNLNPVVADLNVVRFKEKYDLVIICGALHHFVELESVMERMHDALNENGMFVTYEPVMRSGMFLYPVTRVFLGLLFICLPPRLRVNHQDYPGETRIDRYYHEYDRSGWTFECIRSGDIPNLLRKHFKTVHYGRGMTFLRRVSDSIYGRNYRLETRSDRIITEMMCWADRFFRATHLLRPEGLFYIGSRRDQSKAHASS